MLLSGSLVRFVLPHKSCRTAHMDDSQQQAACSLLNSCAGEARWERGTSANVTTSAASSTAKQQQQQQLGVLWLPVTNDSVHAEGANTQRFVRPLPLIWCRAGDGWGWGLLGLCTCL
jgi:hypothetical protein